MKRLLIISPHFPPINAPDMQRVRMSLPYFEKYGWQPTVISVNEKYVDGLIENDLLDTIPGNVEVYKTKAIKTQISKVFGIGSVALRSIYNIYKQGSQILSSQKFDLILFSTSTFHICSLGPIWKRQYNVPFVIDFQDPWYSLNGKEFKLKHKLSDLLHKKLEKFTVPASSGSISVSQAYLNNLNKRYRDFKNKPSAVINFGNSEIDFEILNKKNIQPIDLDKNKINIVSAGALTPKFLPVIEAFFRAFLNSQLVKENYKFYFLGTSYFKTNAGMLADLIHQLKLHDNVVEYPNRIGYFQTLATMKAADILFLPGSLDGDYNPSKICNAIMTGTPVFSVFNKNSIVHELINSSNSGLSVSFNTEEKADSIYFKILNNIDKIKELHLYKRDELNRSIGDYEARNLTKKLCDFFDNVVSLQ